MSTLNQIKTEEVNEQLFSAYSVILYFTGSIITIEPSDDGLPEFCSSGLLRNLPVTSLNPEYKAAIDFFKSPCIKQGGCSENVSNNYNRLFADKDNSLAWPAESAWPSSSDTYLHKVHGSLDDFYLRYSFRPDNDRLLPADHLGVELLFLNKLITSFIKATDPVIKGDIGRDIISFSESHLLNWLPEWVKVVTENSGTKCFKGIAHLILASVEDVKTLVVR